METDSTTTEETNEGLILAAYDAFARGDLGTVFDVLAEDISWHVPGRGPLSGDYRGHKQVLAFFERFLGLSQGTFHIDIDDVMSHGERVVVLVTESAHHDDLVWSSPQVHVWTVKNGKATVFRQFQGDQQSEDEFWSEAASPH
jgi:ketosteroid isomerase-like protein